MLKIPPSIFNAYNICPRQAWFMYRNISPDQQNEYLEIGRLIDETSYSRNKKQIYIADINAELDMIERKDGNIVIVEIKKSSKMLNYAILQLKYYLYLLHKKGIFVKGQISVPKEKTKEFVELTNTDIEKIQKILEEMRNILLTEKPPKSIKKRYCSKCAFFELCWS